VQLDHEPAEVAKLHLAQLAQVLRFAPELSTALFVVRLTICAAASDAF
jgi:hypothetical protein